MDSDRWTAMKPERLELAQQSRLSPLLAQQDSSGGLLSPASLQAVLLAQLAAQHASQLQYQRALLAWTQLSSDGAQPPPPPPPLLLDPAAQRAGSGSSLSGGSGSPTRPDASPPARPARRAARRAKVFTCDVCGRGFGYKHVLQNHARTHTGEKPFQCPQCQKRFTRDHHLKTHMRLHTGERPYQCEHCERRFVQVANLRRHLRVHTGERPYGCRQCQARFPDSNQLKAHMMIHSGQKPFRCGECGCEFRKRYHLVHHKCGMLRADTATGGVGSCGETPLRSRKQSETRRLLRPADAAAGGVGICGETPRRSRKQSETHRLVRPADAPGVGLGEELGAQLEAKLNAEVGAGLGVELRIGLGFAVGTERGQSVFPTDSDQTEPEDLSVPASRWSSSSLDDRLSTSAPNWSPAQIAPDDEGEEKVDTKVSYLQWTSGPAAHGHYEEDKREKEKNLGTPVPPWSLNLGDRHKLKIEPDESRKSSISPQNPAVPMPQWHTPVSSGQDVEEQEEERKASVFSETPRLSVRQWSRMACAGLDRATTARPAPDGTDVRERHGYDKLRPVPDGSWPWDLSITDVQHLRQDVEEEKGHQGVSPSPRDLGMTDRQDPRDEEGKREVSVPPWQRIMADDQNKNEAKEADGVTKRARKMLPPLVPLWIPEKSTESRQQQKDDWRTARETSGVLQHILRTSPSLPPAGYPWSRELAALRYHDIAKHSEDRDDRHEWEGMKSDGEDETELKVLYQSPLV